MNVFRVSRQHGKQPSSREAELEFRYSDIRCPIVGESFPRLSICGDGGVRDQQLTWISEKSERGTTLFPQAVVGDHPSRHGHVPSCDAIAPLHALPQTSLVPTTSTSHALAAGRLHTLPSWIVLSAYQRIEQGSVTRLKMLSCKSAGLQPHPKISKCQLPKWLSFHHIILDASQSYIFFPCPMDPYPSRVKVPLPAFNQPPRDASTA